MKPSMASNLKFHDSDSDDEDEEEAHICWSDVIFLPFNPVFKMFVLISVIAKSTLGPVRSLYSIIHCSPIMDKYIFLSFVKYYYWYFVDLIYLCDTFLHIVHRQVTDKAMRREHLPKSAFLLLLDGISIIPFYTLTSTELCPPVQLWPNILAFTEFIVIYRIVEHFSLLSSHSCLKLVIGFTILLIICVNCMGCFLVLLTVHGLCKNCASARFYDWRKYVIHKLNVTHEAFSTYVHGTSFILGFVLNSLFDITKPSTVLEIMLISIFMIAGYFLDVYVVLPKIFAESILNLRRICTYHPAVRKIVEETKRRNPSPTAYISVKQFYTLMWRKRKGITNIPEVIGELPRYLRIDIRQDLVWPVFYHSPTLRNTSTPFKRWICDFISLDYKLPDEKFFVGPHCHTNLYYLKSGIIELLSADDGVTPLLSLSSGTILGDISFMVPPLKRNLVVRCVTYCEVFILSRYDILKGMQKYPADRKHIMASVKDRMKHARTLYTCKQHVRGLDRAEDEGIAWIKRRWWEISEAVSSWKKKFKTSATKCVLPPEEAVYHCAKYIGQLVLCSEMQMHKKALFANTNFPWIFTHNSTFIRIWHNVVVFTVFLALIMYPPNITRKNVRYSFTIVRCWVDSVYIADICVSLLTSTKKDSVFDNVAAVMFARCKTVQFLLDVFATIWTEVLAILAGTPQYYYVFQFNRLLKVYYLFSSDHINQWSLNREMLLLVSYKVLLANFCYFYIIAHVMHVVNRFLPNLTSAYFFGEKYCNVGNVTVICDLENEFMGVALAYVYELLFFEYPPLTLTDIYFSSVITFIGFIINMVTKARFISFLYLKYRESSNYQSFVSNLKTFYKNHKIHYDLMKRLDRYMICQWKYYQGADIMNPNVLKNEPFDIYWKVHGEVAEKIISESQAFAGADPMLIRELAYAAKFLILPKNATIFLFGVQCRNVTWIVQGHIKCEYHNEAGELLKSYYNPGYMVSVSAVLLQRPSLRTYASCTECELLYIQIQDFFNIIKQYPHEWSHFQNCINEFGPVFEEMFEAYVLKHRDYQKKLRDRIFHARMSISSKRRPRIVENNEWTPLTTFTFESWLDPDSDWMYYWMIFRVIVVIISIASSSLQGGSGAPIRRSLMMTSAFCDAVAWVDIILKLFISYYNEKGILIYDAKMCIAHYLTRGFFLDIVGAVPWFEIFRVILSTEIYDQEAMLINTFCKFAHLYIVMAFFNHIADQPSVNSLYILILKWQLVIVLVMLGASHYLITHCINFNFDSHGELFSMQRRNDCWLPSYMELAETPSKENLHVVFAQSLNLAQSALMRMNLGKFHIDRSNLGVGLLLVILGIIFWYVMCYSVTLLVLAARGSTVYQHGINQLQKFLSAERVDQKLIDEVTAHFGYWWKRNKGINILHLMNERIGVVFKQDLSFYFFKRTFKALDTLLKGGEPMQKQLSSMCQQRYLRPGEEVMREMDLTPYVFVVHRGKVTIIKDEIEWTELTKGSIFGQLDGTEPRPVQVSAVAHGYADMLQMTIGHFQEIITDQVRKTIGRNRQARYDFMAVSRKIEENPYNTIEYILRGRKTIKLPWMKEPSEARRGSWYTRFLYLAWMIEPFVSSVLVLVLSFVPAELRYEIYWGLLVGDIVFLAHFISEYFTMELAVVNDTLVKRQLSYRLLLHWGFYVDTISLIVPMMALVYGNWTYALARLLRLRLFYDFHVHFCNSFKSSLTPILMKVIIVILLTHAMVCGWIFVACRRGPGEEFPVPVYKLPRKYNSSIDPEEWVVPRDRNGGCSRMTMLIKDSKSMEYKVSFLVPRKWQHDYIVALNYIVLLQTHTAMNTVVSLTIKEIYYKILINSFILLVDMWLVSIAIGAVYTKYRELYQYDYSVANLATYLRNSGLSPTLLQTIKEYTRQLWQRQRGNWLPELAQNAPQCLREDLLSALYLHHLKRPALFRNLPNYFTRQLVARFQRVVIFPGKCIVQEGDIFPCMYFIHEGEIEKWYTEPSGEKKFISLLTTNGYFGLIPGLFPSIPFQFSYYTRTVVDLVYLRLNGWQDLLVAYPNVKHEMYNRAKLLKRELMKAKNI